MSLDSRVETWCAAMERARDSGEPAASGPVTLVFARQALPNVRRSHVSDNLVQRGAYVLAEAEGGARRVTLIATGSEVAIATEARETLQAEGVPTAVVSMPCCERFDEQDRDYRDAVLAPGTVRVAIEAAVRFVEAGGSRSIITSLSRIVDGMRGDAGTVVVPD